LVERSAHSILGPFLTFGCNGLSSRIFHNLLTRILPVSLSKELSGNADAVAGLIVRSEPVSIKLEKDNIRNEES
jgi:hypothetical protein